MENSKPEREYSFGSDPRFFFSLYLAPTTFLPSVPESKVLIRELSQLYNKAGLKVGLN
jgi:hypothetical protein